VTLGSPMAGTASRQLAGVRERVVRTNRQKVMRQSRALAVLVLLALAVAGCAPSPTGTDDTASPSSGEPGSRSPAVPATAPATVPVSAPLSTGADLPADAADVILIRVAAFPEGPIIEAGRTDPGMTRVFDLLPDDLPAPLDQPAGCSLGSVTTLELNDGGRVDYGPCRWPETIDVLRNATVQAMGDGPPRASAEADDAPFYGRVVDHELLDGYRGVRVEGEWQWSVGPMILDFADGQSVLVGADTRINTPCLHLPIDGTVADGPCFLIGTTDESGWVTRVKVLSYEILNEGDTTPSLFTRTGGAITVDDTRIRLLDDGTVLLADLDRLDVACAGVTELSRVPDTEVASYYFILDPATAEVISITCSMFLD